MTRSWMTRLVAGAFVVAASSCGDDNTTSPPATDASVVTPAATTPATNATSVPPVAASSRVLFEDSFDDDRNAWGLVNDSEFGSAQFDAGDYVWAFRGRASHWIAGALGDQYDRGELDMLDVTVQAAATVLGGDGVIGVFCRENPDTDAEWQWYEFVAREGYAAIRKSDLEGNLEVLAETDVATVPQGERVTLEATCVNVDEENVMLSMSLDSVVLLEATDDEPLVNGVAGLQAYTFPVHEQLDVHWHEFNVYAHTQ